MPTLKRPPNENWVPDAKHVLCANKLDSFCDVLHYLPTRRPQAEPPMLDYETFIDETLPLDIRFSKLFLDDVERWTKCRDHQTEVLLLEEYQEWLRDAHDYDQNSTNADLYRGLAGNVYIKLQSVEEEEKEAFRGVGALAGFDFENLDQDGKTKKMQACSNMEWKGYLFIFNRDEFSQISEKYGHLAPSDLYVWQLHEYRKSKGQDCHSKCLGCKWDAGEYQSGTTSHKPSGSEDDSQYVRDPMDIDRRSQVLGSEASSDDDYQSCKSDAPNTPKPSNRAETDKAGGQSHDEDRQAEIASLRKCLAKFEELESTSSKKQKKDDESECWGCHFDGWGRMAVSSTDGPPPSIKLSVILCRAVALLQQLEAA